MKTPDIEKAIECLKGHSICLCKGEKIVTDDKKGIAPMMEFLKNEVDLSGFSAADLIVGKAAAMLFVKAKVVCVHGVVMSKNGKDFLEKHGVECSFDTLTENIINRQGTDICPM
ncbi:MAG: DUF1893 domain-containing protein, partial [Clostridia bacterium]|nr:DUF1893 domain-containing protein [Clostridia bacterium]